MKHIFSVFLIATAISCNSPVKKEKSAVTIFDDAITSVIDKDAKVEYLADTFVVAEGPLWDTASQSLLFTDVAQNKMFKWNSNAGVTEFLSPSGRTGYAPSFETGIIGANGITYDAEGNLLLCQHGDRRIAMLNTEEQDSTQFTTIADNYMGKRLNSPNDLTISSEGAIYFTDPPYGFFNLADGTFDNTYKELDFSGVYKISTDNELSLISDSLSLPNGIAISKDDNYLYVNNSDAANPVITRFDLQDDNKSQVFFDGNQLSSQFTGAFDGLKIHSSGMLFTSGPNGILVISPEGKLMASIGFEDKLTMGITNCTFDDKENYLYVTGFSFVARIKLKA